MKRCFLFYLIHLLFIPAGFSQDEIDQSQDKADLLSILEQVKAQVMEVQAKSDTYDQTFSWEEDMAYKIKLVQNIISSKGKSEEMIYEFSLKDLDKNTLKVKNSKDLMMVSMYMDNRQNLIKVFKDGKQQKYEDKLEIAALDIDNARSLETLLSEALPIANKLNLSKLPQSFEDRINWLKENVTALEIGENSFSQVLEQDIGLKTVLHFTLTKEGDKKPAETWHFNLGDFNERGVQRKIEGKEVLVKIQTTRNLKFIELEKEGKENSFTNKVAFLAADPEKAGMIEEVLKALIRESKDLEKKRFSPSTTDLQTSLNLLSEQLQSSNLQAKGKSYTQNMEAQCVTTLDQEIGDDKGKSSENKYLFNLADINENKIDVNISGKGVFLNVATGKDKLIQTFENGEIKNYTNKISIPAKDIENVKWLLHAFPVAIEHCKAQEKEEVFTVKGNSFDWIQQSIAGFKEVRQSLEKVEDARCKLKFTTTKEGKKEDTEEVYEFNLFDLNPKSIDLEISGKSLAIQIPTMHKEKNIKYYKNGEPGNYKNEMLIQMENIEQSRLLINIWKKEIESCKE